jgi:hypothetical protein
MLPYPMASEQRQRKEQRTAQHNKQREGGLGRGGQHRDGEMGETERAYKEQQRWVCI